MPVERRSIESHVRSLIRQTYSSDSSSQEALNQLGRILTPYVLKAPTAPGANADANAAAIIIAETPPQITARGRIDLLIMSIVDPLYTETKLELYRGNITIGALAAHYPDAAFTIFQERKELMIIDRMLLTDASSHPRVAEGIIDTMPYLLPMSLRFGGGISVGEHIIKHGTIMISVNMDLMAQAHTSEAEKEDAETQIQTWRNVIDKGILQTPRSVAYLEKELVERASGFLVAPHDAAPEGMHEILDLLQLTSIRGANVIAEILKSHIDKVTNETRALITNLLRD